MVDPYDFTGSPSPIKSKQTRKKTIMKTSKKTKSNEKPRRVSIRQMNNKSRRSNMSHVDPLNDINEKENNPNNGFTQLIETKMMDVKRRQGKRINKKVTIVTEDNHSPLIPRKRPRTDVEDNFDAIQTKIGHNPPSRTIGEHVHARPIKTINPPFYESKNRYFILPNKRRRACLCSKRQLDELEFATDSFMTQSPGKCIEEQQIHEKSNLEPHLTDTNHSPPPLLLPSSHLILPLTSTITVEPIKSVSINQPHDNHEETEEEEVQERENQLHVSSIMGGPQSPTMPPNATYIAHRSIPLIAQIPSALLSISTGIPHNTTTILSHSTQKLLTPSIIENSNFEQNITAQSLSLLPIPSTLIRQDQETSMTPTAVKTKQCSVSTQTSDDDYPIHYPCNDVSLCPCVHIYTRSEQLFMTSMSVFFRNTITVAPPDQLFTTVKNTKATNNKRQQSKHPTITPEPIPIIEEIPTQNESNIVKHNNIKINETYVVKSNINKNDIVPLIQIEHQPSAHVLFDTSTVIHETPYDNSKKSDGSSIQVNINSKVDANEKLHEIHSSSLKSSIDQEKFKSLVLAMTALKDDQKIEFNRFVEHFSVRTSTTIDETTTHLITDEDDEHTLKCPLTAKILQGVARHLTIVSYRWLTACLTQKHYVDEIPTYEIIGDTVYNDHYGMSRSRLNKLNDYHLLANFAFHLKCNGCPPFMDNRPLIELIHLSGGVILKTLNEHINKTERKMVILCSKTYLQNKLALQQACQNLDIHCIEPEWLIASIVKFEIQPFQPWLCTLYS